MKTEEQIRARLEWLRKERHSEIRTQSYIRIEEQIDTLNWVLEEV